MLHDLTIVHRRKPGTFNPAALNRGDVWETCLRSLGFFVGPLTVETLPDDQVFTSLDAYQFLLETVCGLYSPIVAETEVFGQFKIYAAGWVEQDPSRAPFIQRVLNDAKAIRSQFLKGLGNQSYGAWLRKNLLVTSTHVLGAGHLAGEILPYLQKQSAVRVHARNPAGVNLVAEVVATSARLFDRGALIVAAPISAVEINAWLNGKVPDQIFDLRDNAALDPVAPGAISLTDIFGHIEQTRLQLLPVIERARQEISIRATAAHAAEKVRPQGWDDLCA